MADFIRMPKLGLTMTEGTIADWRKAEGDTISSGEIIFDVETDKIVKEFEATASGVLRKIIVSEGTVDVLEPIAIIGTADEDISALLAQLDTEGEAPAQTQPKEEEKVKGDTPKTMHDGRIKASPRAKKVALEFNVDITAVEGTGPQGAITEKDIMDFVEKSKETSRKISPTPAVVAEGLEVDSSKTAKDSRIMKKDNYKFKFDEDLFKFADPQDYREHMSLMRQIIAKRMSESQHIASTVNYNQRVDAAAMQRLREELKSVKKISYTDIIVKILSKVLLEFPLLNSSLIEDEIVLRNYANIGIAVSLPEGLIVPVVKYANVKSLLDISKEIKDLAEKAKNNELKSDDVTGGTFTITNIGMFGMESFTPIINQPEVAILGINTIQDTPMVVDGQVVIKPMMNLSLTADHRVVDGAIAAQFVARLKEYIEKPGLLLL